MRSAKNLTNVSWRNSVPTLRVYTPSAYTGVKWLENMHPEIKNTVGALIASFGLYLVPILTFVAYVAWGSWLVLVLGGIAWLANGAYINKSSARASDKPFNFFKYVGGLAIILAAYIALNILLGL